MSSLHTHCPSAECCSRSPSQLPWIRGWEKRAGCWEGMWLCAWETKNRAWGPLLLGWGQAERLLTGPEAEPQGWVWQEQAVPPGSGEDPGALQG